MSSGWFQRYLLPGLAFKGLVIGGGYATGRELAEFFLPSGPRGGLLAIALAAAIWSVICIATFVLARITQSYDYRSFFQHVLGRAWVVFEAAYFLFVVLILAVFGAAAGAIGQAMFGWPLYIGTLCLLVAIAGFVAYGNTSVEGLFKWASIFLYSVYAIFVVLALTSFGERIVEKLALAVPTDGWMLAGVTYASYNVVGAVVILPMLRHLTSNRDAVIAGALTGPLAMLPALLFFLCMVAFYPQIAGEALPSDFLLRRMNLPIFHAAFQLMIFAALLESGVAAVHAVNERIALVWQARHRAELGVRGRVLCAGAVLVVAMLLAERFGLVTLIARGYRALAYLIVAVYVVPVLIFGIRRLWRSHAAPARA